MPCKELIDMYGSKTAILTAADAGSDEEVIATPGAGLKIVIDGLVWATAGAGSALLESGGSVPVMATLQHAGAATTVVPSVYVSCAVNAALVVTTVGAGVGAWSLFVQYHLERA